MDHVEIEVSDYAALSNRAAQPDRASQPPCSSILCNVLLGVAVLLEGFGLGALAYTIILRLGERGSVA